MDDRRLADLEGSAGLFEHAVGHFGIRTSADAQATGMSSKQSMTWLR